MVSLPAGGGSIPDFDGGTFMPRCRLTNLAAVGAALVLLATPATAADRESEGSRPVRWEGTRPITLANFAASADDDLSRCTIGPAGFASPCVVPITPLAGYDLTLSGGVEGTAPSAYSADLAAFVSTSQPADIPIVSFERVIATVVGCGTGSFLLRTDSNLGSPSHTWTIVPHSGRGELLGLSGSGTATNAFDGPQGQLHTVATGRLRCDSARTPSS